MERRIEWDVVLFDDGDITRADLYMSEEPMCLITGHTTAINS